MTRAKNSHFLTMKSYSSCTTMAMTDASSRWQSFNYFDDFAFDSSPRLIRYHGSHERDDSVALILLDGFNSAPFTHLHELSSLRFLFSRYLATQYGAIFTINRRRHTVERKVAHIGAPENIIHHSRALPREFVTARVLQKKPQHNVNSLNAAAIGIHLHFKFTSDDLLKHLCFAYKCLHGLRRGVRIHFVPSG